MTAALIAGNVSCSQPAGGNTYVPDGGYNGGNGDQTGGNEQGGTIGGGTGTGGNENPDPTDPVTPPVTPKYPDYYINEEFGGQRFVEYGTRWDNTSNGDFTACYDNAKKFLADKVTDLQNDLNGQTNNQYYNMINTALQKYNSQQNNISNDIDTNYTALTPIFKEIAYTLLDKSEKDYYTYQVSYYKLAHNAYQNSLSSLSKNTTFQVNKQMMSDIYPGNFFAQELADTNLSYDELTLDKATNIMNNALTEIKNKTGVTTAVLKKVVDLAMYNESLYGLNDFAKAEGVNNQNLRHEHYITDFQNYINGINYNIDDGRTM